ncbi:sel1 repeat family protein [bacterium]|nr:sel1 repeat family protein [bacterium]
MRFLAILTVFIGLFFQNCGLFAQSKPAWISQVHYVEGDTHYFVGRSSRQIRNEDGIERALANALSIVSKYIKAEVKSLSKSYEEASKDSSEVFINDVFSERGASIVVRNYIKDSYFEKVISGGETYYETYVKIGVSQNDIIYMGIKADAAAAWNFKSAGCGEGQSGEILMVFKEAAARLGWKLEPEQSEKPGFSKDFPRTAYFVSVTAGCSGGMMSVAVERYDLIEKLLVTSAYSKADSLRNLKSDLFNSLQIYVPMVDFPEYPDAKNSSFLNDLPANLRTLYSDALKAEEKGRLNPAKAESLWQTIAGYGGSNPLRSLAQNRVNFYGKMSFWRSQLAAGEKKEFNNLGKMAKSPSFDIKAYSSAVAEYIDLYGAWAGSARVGEVFDFIEKSERKEEVRKKVFSESDKFFSWQRSCEQGDPAKCYLVSLKGDGESVSLKKYACEYKVEKACLDLYKASVNGNDAARFAEKSCYLGNSDSCVNAAGILYQGKMKAVKDVEKSVAILEDSCGADSGESCYMLGVIYDGGSKSIKKDSSKAKEFYKKSCGLGYKKSCRY